jgi:hypothetical protein
MELTISQNVSQKLLKVSLHGNAWLQFVIGFCLKIRTPQHVIVFTTTYDIKLENHFRRLVVE